MCINAIGSFHWDTIIGNRIVGRMTPIQTRLLLHSAKVILQRINAIGSFHWDTIIGNRIVGRMTPIQTRLLLHSAKVILQRIRMMASVKAQPQQPSSSSPQSRIYALTTIAFGTISQVVAPKRIASIVRSTQRHTWSARWPIILDVAPVLTKIYGGFE